MVWQARNASDKNRRLNNSPTCSQSTELQKAICDFVPKNFFASYLWNEELRNQDSALHVAVDVLEPFFRQFLNSFHLRQALGRRPRNLHDILTKRSRQDSLRVWIIAHPLDETEEGASWISIVQTIAEHYCIPIEWKVFKDSFADTVYYTHFLRLLRWKTETERPDIILHALSRRDMEAAHLETRDPTSVVWEEERRFVLQDFVRAAREVGECDQAKSVPAIVFLDDFIPPQSSRASLWVHQVNRRMLQQVADYYDVGLISYVQVMQRLVRASGSQWVEPNSETGQSPLLVHHTMALVLLYAVFDFIVSACDVQQPSVESIIAPDLQHRIATVMPPYLDARQTLLTVSQEWQWQEQETQDVNACRGSCLDATYHGAWENTTTGKQLKASSSASLEWSIQGPADRYEVTIFLLLNSPGRIDWLARAGEWKQERFKDLVPSTNAIPITVSIADVQGNLSLELNSNVTVSIVAGFLCPERSPRRSSRN